MVGLLVVPYAMALATENRAADIAATLSCLPLGVFYLNAFVQRWSVY